MWFQFSVPYVATTKSDGSNPLSRTVAPDTPPPELRLENPQTQCSLPCQSVQSSSKRMSTLQSWGVIAAHADIPELALIQCFPNSGARTTSGSWEDSKWVTMSRVGLTHHWTLALATCSLPGPVQRRLPQGWGEGGGEYRRANLPHTHPTVATPVPQLWA